MLEMLYVVGFIWVIGTVIRATMHLANLPTGVAYILHRIEEEHGEQDRGTALMLIAVVFFSVVLSSIFMWPHDLYVYRFGFFRPLSKEELVAEIDAAFLS